METREREREREKESKANEMRWPQEKSKQTNEITTRKPNDKSARDYYSVLDIVDSNGEEKEKKKEEKEKGN